MIQFRERPLLKHSATETLPIEDQCFRGVKDSLGPSATLVVGGVEVVVASERRQCLDREMLRVVCIELSNFRLLVIKSAVHSRADFYSVAAHIFDADTPGTNRPDFNAYKFKHLPRPIYPLDKDVSGHE